MADINSIALVALVLVLVGQCCFVDCSKAHDNINWPKREDLDQEFHVRVKAAISKFSTSSRLFLQAIDFVAANDEYSDIYRLFTRFGAFSKLSDSHEYLAKFNDVFRSIVAQIEAGKISEIDSKKLLVELNYTAGNLVEWLEKYIEKLKVSSVVDEFDSVFGPALNSYTKYYGYDDKLRAVDLTNAKLNVAAMFTSAKKDKTIFKRSGSMEDFENFMDINCWQLQQNNMNDVAESLNLIAAMRRQDAMQSRFTERLRDYHQFCKLWFNGQKDVIKANLKRQME